jgi:hypothetical protein
MKQPTETKQDQYLMYINIGLGSSTIGNVGGFVNARYWSSSETGGHNARGLQFNGGLLGGGGKNSMLSVRAVRAFRSYIPFIFFTSR